MKEEELRSRLMALTSIAAGYCSALENCRDCEREDFIRGILGFLPRIYWEFSDLSVEENPDVSEFDYFPEYVDEDYYESVRRSVEAVMGEDDVFLETFEEDMKYSDTPVAASVSESLADIFQPLYNFISVVKDSEGENAASAFRECKENFESYWSQTLCNVMRALNNIRYQL